MIFGDWLRRRVVSGKDTARMIAEKQRFAAFVKSPINRAFPADPAQYRSALSDGSPSRNGMPSGFDGTLTLSQRSATRQKIASLRSGLAEQTRRNNDDQGFYPLQSEDP